MRILLMGDASNFHRTLATGLRRLGCDVTVASSGSGFMQTARDIDLRRPLPGKAGGLALWMRLNGPLRDRLKGYDIVSCSNCVFLDLRPERVRKIFHRLKRDNGAIFLTALGTDLPYIEECLDPDSQLRYNEFRIHGEPSPYALEHPEIIQAWQSSPLRDWCDEFYANIDGAVSALYEYHLALSRRLPAGKIAYGGIPIDTDTPGLSPADIPANPSPVKIFLGRHRHRMAEKGTDRFETAICRAIAKNPGKGELIIVENRPYGEYINLMRNAHIIVDQAYSYTPATNALLSMAYGIPTVSGGEPAFYDFIGEPSGTGPSGAGSQVSTAPTVNRPIINSPVDIDGMTAMFDHYLNHPGQLRTLGSASRDFVLRHNSCDTVARRFLTFWQSRLR